MTRAELVKRLRERVEVATACRSPRHRRDLPLMTEAADALEADAGVRGKLVEALQDLVNAAQPKYADAYTEERLDIAMSRARAALSAVREG